MAAPRSIRGQPGSRPSGAAGTGNISFSTGLAGTLKIDNAALNGNAFTNTISNFNPGQKIDLTGLQYNTQNPSLNTVSLSGNTLSISNGTTTDTLTVNGLDGGTRFQLTQDANGGTIVQITSTRVFNVASVADLNAAILQMDSGGQNAAQNANYTINITANFSLTSELYAFNLLSGSSVTINGSDGHGGTYTIDGLNAQRGFFVYAGNVNLENLTIQNTVAAGGGVVRGGGGGGAGLGGALFISSNGSATIDNVIFHNSAAIGGNGGSGGTGSITSFYGLGGGGGMGGRGGSSGGGGIGLGAQGSDSVVSSNGAGGIVPGTAGGGKRQRWIRLSLYGRVHPQLPDQAGRAVPMAAVAAPAAMSASIPARTGPAAASAAATRLTAAMAATAVVAARVAMAALAVAVATAAMVASAAVAASARWAASVAAMAAPMATARRVVVAALAPAAPSSFSKAAR